MTKHQIKLSYIPSQYRVRVEFTKADTNASPLPPPDLMQRAKKRLTAELENGHLDFYRFFQRRLVKMWQFIRSSYEEDSTSVEVTLAMGAPKIDIQIKESKEPNILCLISIKEPVDELIKLKFHILKLSIGKAIRDSGIKDDVPDPAHIHAIYLRACSGESIKKEPLYANPKIDWGDHLLRDPYQIKVNEADDYISLVVFNVRSIIDDRMLRTIISQLQEKAYKLGSLRNCQYEIMSDHMVRTIRSAYKGPERYGLDLPLVILVAVKQGSYFAHSELSAAPVKAKVRDNEATHWNDILPLVAIKCSKDGMVAKIGTCDMKVFSKFKGRDKRFWQKFFEMKGVVAGLIDKNLDSFCRYINEQIDPEGMVIAEGRVPVRGEVPYVHQTYKDVKQDENITFLESQPSKFVKMNEVIADIRYKVPAVEGVDIWGMTNAPPEPEVLNLELGDGVLKDEEGRYIAAYDGVPNIDGTKISVDKVLIYEKNVNRTDGFVNYDGDILVKGNIEIGSRLCATGELIVNGSIEGGWIKVDGNIKVDGGIVASPEKAIVSNQSITARFIENSRIQCQGDLLVDASIIAAEIVSGGDIAVINESGIIISSVIHCWGEVKCPNVGRATGPKTKINVGFSYDGKRALDIRRKRTLVWEAYLEELKGLYSALNLPASQMTKKKKEQKMEYKKKMTRLAKIIPALKDREKMAVNNLEYNDEAQIYIQGTLSANCIINMAGTEVPITTGDMHSVAVLSKPYRGSHFLTIDLEDVKSS